ncbi:MAG: Ni/Fe hydrogenase subunit gamma, partial [Chloroflexota bacterium]
MSTAKALPDVEQTILPEPMQPVPWQVTGVTHETTDSFTLELEPTGNADVLPFLPGQFNMLYVFGIGEVPISISGNPNTPHQLVHTTRAVGTVTKAMRNLRIGDSLGVRGP